MKIYGGFKKNEKEYSYGSNREDFEVAREEIEVDNAEEAIFFMNNYFGADIAPGYSWQYVDVATKERRDELIASIDNKTPKAEKLVKVVEAKEEEVVCTCGHVVPKSMVMIASMGTTCPDCYDKMSL